MEIKKYPARILRQKSQSITKITQRERDLFDEMFLIMQKAEGIGLAAPQVGINQRIIVADAGSGPVKLANPEAVKIRGRERMEEGCLSVPGVLVKIERPFEVTVKGLNEKGDLVTIEAKGLLARVLMHEIDHLNGKLIIDYMNFLQRLSYNLNSKRKGQDA